MRQLELSNVWCAPLQGVSLRAGSGCVVIVVESEPPGAMLINLLAGLKCPTRGAIRLDGQSPHQAPALRGHLGTLLANEEPLAGARLDEALGRTLAPHLATVVAISAILANADLLEERSKHPTLLSYEQRRKLALAIALATPSPKLLALFEPLMFSEPAFREQVLASLVELAESTPVVCVTASTRDATALGGTLYFLNSLGVLRGPVPVDEVREPQPKAGFLVECDDPARLAQALSTQPAVSDVRWFEEHALGIVEALGADIFAVSQAIASAVLDTGSNVRAVRSARRLRDAEQPGEPRP